MSNLSHQNYTGDNGDRHPFKWKPSDSKALLELYYHRKLTGPWWCTLLDGRGQKGFMRRVGTRLCREGTHPTNPHPIYVIREQQALGRHAFYSLAPAGLKKLQEDGLVPKDETPEPHSFPAHDLLESMVLASLRIGAKKHGVEFILRSELTRHIPVESGTYTPDLPHPITLRKNGQELNIIGIEIDMGTEPYEPPKKGGACIKEKFDKLAEIYRDKLFEKHHELKNGIVLFVSVDRNGRDRRAWLMKKAQAHLGNASWLCFLKWENFYATSINSENLYSTTLYRKIPDPSGYVFDTPYKRVGHPDYNLPSKFGEAIVRKKEEA